MFIYLLELIPKKKRNCNINVIKPTNNKVLYNLIYDFINIFNPIFGCKISNASLTQSDLTLFLSRKLIIFYKLKFIYINFYLLTKFILLLFFSLCKVFNNKKTYLYFSKIISIN